MLVIPAACGRNQGSVAGFCRAVKAAPDLATSLTGFSDADPGELRNRLDRTRRSYDRIAAEAPGPIRSDARRVVDLVDAIVDAAGRQPGDPADAIAQTRKAVADHPDAATSAAAVSRFARQRCGVSLGPASVATTAVGTASTTTETTSPAPTTTG